MFVRSIDWVEREAIEIELEEDDGENGLIEDWSKVRKVCQRLYDERAGKARWKARDGAPSEQEEGKRRREPARIGFKARIAEAYEALEAMLADEERMRPQAPAEEADLPYEIVEVQYDGTTEGGVGPNTLLM